MIVNLIKIIGQLVYLEGKSDRGRAMVEETTNTWRIDAIGRPGEANYEWAYRLHPTSEDDSRRDRWVLASGDPDLAVRGYVT